MSRRKEQSDADRERLRLEGDEIDLQFGFERYKHGEPRVGWLLNYLAISMPDDTGSQKSGVDLYFIDREGGNFKATLFYEPYFYLVVPNSRQINEISQALERKFEGCKCESVKKEDLDLPNHLSGKLHQMIKISFGTVRELMDAKMFLRPIVEENKKVKASVESAYLDGVAQEDNNIDAEGYDDFHGKKSGSIRNASDPFGGITDMREYDVPYTMRVAIDLDLRVGSWHEVWPIQGSELCNVVRLPDMLERCEPSVLAFDIECEKDPLKFPNPERDRVFMISYMIDGQGYLLINRDVVSADISDFDYTQLEQYPGPFQVINLPDEKAVLKKFVLHVQELRPHVIVTYNGDFFDWPYVEQRCEAVGKHDKEMNLYKMLGIRNSSGGASTGVVGGGEYTGRTMVHLDAFCWVNRDSYLPQGNRGLKAVTRYKLGYDPIEVDPEDMLPLAKSEPEKMAAYSVSDAVATYYLYQKYVHNFIFSLATIIPMVPEDVLRKGSGTLCEALLMVEAYRCDVICPNKEADKSERFYKGHLVESETYIGGHVECLEAGVFRKDIPCNFDLTPAALQDLIDHVDRDLTFALEVENGIERSDVSNYDEVKQDVVEALELLRDTPRRKECPAIYHLDVGAMYPNIILTNRLQPSSMVSLSDCAACEFNHPSSNCKRDMVWTWRGEYSPSGLGEYHRLKESMQYQKFPSKNSRDKEATVAQDGRAAADKDLLVSFGDLSIGEQNKLAASRLKEYSQRVYRKNKITSIEDRTDTVCMRENGFYVDTVRAFRDRRYDYKLETKKWKGAKGKAEKEGDALAKKKAEDMEVLMDSLQLAHKCILNSFYGYVMRKGARWRSMEMAGIVTRTGADLITKARELVENIGRPLELDTDGIWCIVPQSFPQEYKFKLKNGKSVKLEYPCAMLNADVHMNYTNHQYQDLKVNTSGKLRKGAAKEFNVKSECSIYFELDGPYQCMVLPASPEEGKLLKKKYVVYNEDGSIAELKGFEMKRRGELELVKIFQEEVFKEFLKGDSLEECYENVGDVGNYWLEMIDSRGENVDDDELMSYISEKKTISKTIDEYEGRKATSLTTAQRLADFLGAEMVKDKGLNCQLIISKYPLGAPVTERAIPTAIFGADKATKEYWLRKWLKNSSLNCEDFRELLDWDYYKDRLAKSVQKIVTLPAGLQGIKNPCPSVEHPTWLQRIVNEKASGLKQAKITNMFAKLPVGAVKGAKGRATPNKVGALVASGGILSPARSGRSASPSRHQSPGKVRLMSSPARNNAMSESARKRLYSSVEGGAGVPGGLFGESPVRNSSPSRNAVAPVSSSRPPLFPLSEAEEEAEQPKVLVMRDSKPGSEVELQSWLAARKNKWSALRKERAATRPKRNSYTSRSGAVNVAELYGDKGPNKKAKSVEDIVKSASMSASHGFWQIIEMQESDSPGEFVVWAMTTKQQLQRLRIQVPRTIYVNVVGLNAERNAKKLGGVQIKKDLPHGRPCMKLFEVNFSEARYQRHEKALANFLTDPNVEGVYESQVPLWFRAVTQLGCVTKVAKTASAAPSGGPNRTYKMSELEQVNVAQHPYLESTTSVFKRVYLYMSENKISNNGMGCLGLFLVHGTNVDAEELGESAGVTATSYVWFVQGNNRINHVRPPMDRFFRESLPHGSKDRITFVTMTETSFDDAFNRCNDQLNVYLQRRNGPTVVVAQGMSSPKIWRKRIPALQEFPLAAMPVNSADNQYAAVGWQRDAATTMIGRYHLFPRWFSERLMCARYAHAPVCNLGNDLITTTIDIIFARQLTAQRHLLWATEKPMPDVAGEELDLQSLWGDALSKPQINNIGAYRNICCELSLTGLAICAIMNSASLTTHDMSFGVNANAGLGAAEEGNATGAMFGVAGADNEGEEGSTPIEPLTAEEAEQAAERFLGGVGSVFSDSSCIAAFHHLKSKVAMWWHDINVKNDVISDHILTSLYRYLCGFGDALLHDPALYRLIYGLMSKLFRNLVGELTRLGAHIVYADFNRIVLHTEKSTLDTAASYVQFLIDTIETKDLYLYMELTQKEFLEQMLWLGPENYGALGYPEAELIRVLSPGEASTAVEELEYDESEDGGKKDGPDDMGIDNEASAKIVHFAKEELVEESLTEDQAHKNHKELFGKRGDNAVDEDEIDDDDGQGRSGESLDWLYGEEGDGEDGSLEASRAGAEDNRYATEEPLYSGEAYEGMTLEEDPLLVSNWNLAASLHPTANIQFKLVVSEYLYKFQKLQAKFASQRDRFLALEKAGFEADKMAHDMVLSGEGEKEASNLSDASLNTTKEDMEVSGVEGRENSGNAAQPEELTEEQTLHQQLDEDGFVVEEDPLEMDENGEYIGPVSEEEVRDRVVESMKLYIKGSLMEKMLDTVDELKEYLPHAEGEKGAHLSVGQQRHMMNDVALDFVKATMHVLLVDKSLGEEVANLRKRLLAHLKIREFSEDSRYHDIAASYVLRDIICGFCKSCRDVDLLKDPHLTEGDRYHRWSCVDCGNMLDTVEIENRLLNETERLTSSFLMQDARCSVTHQVSTKLCSAVSHIAAPLDMDVSSTAQHQKFTVLYEVAKLHGFSLLQSTLEEVMDH